MFWVAYAIQLAVSSLQRIMIMNKNDNLWWLSTDTKQPETQRTIKTRRYSAHYEMCVREAPT